MIPNQWSIFEPRFTQHPSGAFYTVAHPLFLAGYPGIHCLGSPPTSSMILSPFFSLSPLRRGMPRAQALDPFSVHTHSLVVTPGPLVFKNPTDRRLLSLYLQSQPFLGTRDWCIYLNDVTSYVQNQIPRLALHLPRLSSHRCRAIPLFQLLK